MQPTTRELQAMAAAAAGAGQISMGDLRNNGHAGPGGANGGGGGVHDDFLDQMFGSLPPSAWHELATAAAAAKPPEDDSGMQQQQQFGGPYDESVMLASRLRQNQISGGGGPGSGAGGAAKQMVLQQLADLRQAGHGHGHHMMLQGGTGRGDSGMILPLTLGNGGSGGDVQALLKAAANSAGGEAGVFGGFAGSLQQQQQHFQPHPQQQTAPMPNQTFGGGAASGGGAQPQAGAGGGGGGGTQAPPRQRVRARRGQATDPHSIAERLRRERIAERMKALQELVPNANKTDKASMLDEIIDYVKFLQLQVKVLSMSRLGGAAAVAPLVADMSSEGRGGAGNGGGPAAESDSLTVTEQQVAKLMEEDMGAAMQYLQGKGLCLMPVSLASAISSATCQLRPPSGHAFPHHLNAMRQMHDAAVPASPSMSVLTAQSAMVPGNNGGACAADGGAEASHPKDAASVSKP
ncbi:transcription factor bHLH66 isoform X1 [Brachypodium distachyon]|uniref:BHLH domain-containing protein n=1 Tax=Brachypodium distachyon TaxID=15368 RepID=A0A0Q3IW26_BRADI|nr:transcription factor bHLH66 isoform X1 [Brachypodium distachyon]KQJ90248.1 hypothetical protein BRADI_4g30350v3 [Brachypodium distachyon]|eukprot:XP_010238168.1 transcription factor bHLH66 isoform X1 [Brachypodium distachyon]